LNKTKRKIIQTTFWLLFIKKEKRIEKNI